MNLAPMRSTADWRLSRRGAGRTPGVTVMPDRSVILCVLIVILSLEYVPADVRSTRWKVYSVSTASPLIFVASVSVGRGIPPALLPLRNRLNERISAVASCMGSHSSTTEVWVAFRQRSTGGEGDCCPKVVYISVWSEVKAFWEAASLV